MAITSKDQLHEGMTRAITSIIEKKIKEKIEEHTLQIKQEIAQEADKIALSVLNDYDITWDMRNIVIRVKKEL